jgi:hypothetical protein
MLIARYSGATDSKPLDGIRFDCGGFQHLDLRRTLGGEERKGDFVHAKTVVLQWAPDHRVWLSVAAFCAIAIWWSR